MAIENVSSKFNESSHSIVTISDNEFIYTTAYHIIRMIPTLRPVSKRSRESYDWMGITIFLMIHTRLSVSLKYRDPCAIIVSGIIKRKIKAMFYMAFIFYSK